MHSMQRCLWSPPDADLMDIMLYDGDKIQERSGRWRKRLLRQHARALNTAYLQVGGGLLHGLLLLHMNCKPLPAAVPWPAAVLWPLGCLIGRPQGGEPDEVSFFHAIGSAASHYGYRTPDLPANLCMLCLLCKVLVCVTVRSAHL